LRRLAGDKKKIGCKIKNFAIKLFDTNPLLRDKKIILNPSKAWRILIEFNLATRACGAGGQREKKYWNFLL